MKKKPYCDVLSSNCERKIEVRADGQAEITVEAQSAAAIHVGRKL